MVVQIGQFNRSAGALSTPDFESVLLASLQFLGRWRDAYTRSATDELAQRTVIEVWRGAPKLRDPNRVEAFARTVARRQRWRALRKRLRVSVESIDDDPDLADLLVVPEQNDGSLAVGGRWIDKRWLLEQLDGALAELTALNGRLLLSYYEGFNCAELAQRYSLSEDAVKLRLHRSRRRVRRHIESRARRENCDG